MFIVVEIMLGLWFELKLWIWFRFVLWNCLHVEVFRMFWFKFLSVLAVLALTVLPSVEFVPTIWKKTIFMFTRQHIIKDGKFYTTTIRYPIYYQTWSFVFAIHSNMKIIVSDMFLGYCYARFTANLNFIYVFNFIFISTLSMFWIFILFLWSIRYVMEIDPKLFWNWNTNM